MPRRADPRMEERILNTAQQLWQRGGQRALTMRAIAEAAGTNTPTIYRRFKSRRDIEFALVQRVQRDLISALQPSRSPEETCVRYVEFAMNHTREYKLLQAHIGELLASIPSPGTSITWSSKPILELIGKQLAGRLGGSAGEHVRLSLALWALAHGTTTLLMSKWITKRNARQLRAAFAAAVDTLTCSQTLAHNDLWLA